MERAFGFSFQQERPSKVQREVSCSRYNFKDTKEFRVVICRERKSDRRVIAWVLG